MPILKLKNEYFFETWTPDMAYVLGFFAADGNMRITKRLTAYIELTSCDKEILKKIKHVMQLEHIIGRQNRGTSRKIVYRIQVGSKIFYHDLAKLGLTSRKSLTLKMPFVPAKYVSHFVRGYFDGDGSVSLLRYWRKDRGYYYWSFSSRFTSGSKRFLLALFKTLKPYVKGGHINKKKRGGYDLVFSRHDSVALFRFMYNNVSADLFLERKYRIFKKAFRVLRICGCSSAG